MSQEEGLHGGNSVEPEGRCSLCRVCVWLQLHQAPSRVSTEHGGRGDGCSVAAGRQTQGKSQFLMVAQALRCTAVSMNWDEWEGSHAGAMGAQSPRFSAPAVWAGPRIRGLEPSTLLSWAPT